ncbi:hypothetical protein JCM6882_001316 [Rhodosporidiobolus microsporus]
MPVVSLSPWHFTEGVLTLDVLLRLVSSTLLNPSLTILAPLAAAINRHRALAASHTAPSWAAYACDPAIVSGLGLWAVGAALKVNEWLSRAVRNSLTRGIKPWVWENEVVVVTGGAGGLGSEVARRLSARRTKVVLLDVAPLSFELPSNVHYYNVDLSNRDAVFEVKERIVKEVGAPSVLINGAGVVRAESILDMTPRDIDLTYDINVKAHYYTVQAFLPGMIKEGHGHVVTIASSTGYHQAASGVAYCSSKAAAISFHEGLTEELRHLYPHNTLISPTPAHARAVRTSVVCPAHFKTPMFEGFKNTIPEWAAPSLEVGTVAGLVCETVWSGESQHIIEPFYAKCTPVGRALPTWLYSIILFFAKDAMGLVKVEKDKVAKKE